MNSYQSPHTLVKCMKFGDYEGTWWLPDDPKQKIPGKLIISSEDIILELKGSFATRSDFYKIYDIILGKLDNAKTITLHDCFLFSSGSTEGIHRSRYNTHYIFEGVHFHRKKDIKFHEIRLVFDHLNEWIGKSNFDIGDYFSSDNIEIKYTNTPPIKNKINSNLELEVFSGLNRGSLHFPVTEINLKQTSYIGIKSKKLLSLDETIKIVGGLQNFLTFALNCVVKPLFIGANFNKKNTTRGQFDPEFCDITYLTVTSTLPTSSFNRTRVYFQLSEVEDKIGKLLNNWLKLESKLDVVTQSYFTIIYSSVMYNTQKFLYLAKSIEGYHRLTMNNQVISKSEHKKRIKEIRDSLPLQHKKIVMEKLSFLNEPTLNTRLLEIVDKFDFVLGKSTTKKVEKFTQIFRHTRNSNTHLGTNVGKKKLNDSQMTKFNLRLLIMLEMIFLDYIGFTNNEIKLKMKNRIRYTFLKQIIE